MVIRMSTTDILAAELDNLSKKLCRLEQRKLNAEASCKSCLDSINLQYSATIEEANRHYADEIKKIADYKAEIPAEILASCSGIQAIPKKTDFALLDRLRPMILDSTFGGGFKKVFSISGYSSQREMVEAYNTELANGEKYHQTDCDKKKQNAKATLDKKKTEAENKRASQLNNIKSEADRLFASQTLPNIKAAIHNTFASLGEEAVSWKQFVPSQSMAKEVLVGRLKYACDIPAAYSKQVKVLLSPYYSDGKVEIPFTLDSHGRSLCLWTMYGNQFQRNQIVKGFQIIILRLLKFMPVGSVHITFLDPLEKGSNIGRLKELISPGERGFLTTPAALKTDVLAQLKTLEDLATERSKKLANIGTIYDYNRTNKPKMKFHALFIHDYPEGFTQNELDILEGLIHNAEKCGIYIFCSVRGKTSDGYSEKREYGIAEKMHNRFTNVICGSDFEFSNSDIVSDQFISQAKLLFENSRIIDNSFDRICDLKKPIQWRESTEKLLIPFAVNARNKIVELELGGSSTAHSILSGETGSGKSTTLHALIAGIVLNYHPDDVALWLVDYKHVEFNEYVNNTPPHVKMIAMDTSEEFSFDLLKVVRDEFEGRKKLFTSKGVTNITDYKKKYGTTSLPRIILIIDEFHVLTQAAEKEPQYAQMLENALSEYRALGLSCIFSDQTISVGLRGLTAKGKMQLSNRIAMRNKTFDEIFETLSVDRAYYTDDLKEKINTLQKGEVILKKEHDEGLGTVKIVIDKYKAVFVQQTDRKRMVPYILKGLGVTSPQTKDFVLIDGQERQPFDAKAKQNIARLEQENPPLPAETPLYIGTPSGIAPIFHFRLTNRAGENVMIIGDNDEMRMSILWYSIRSFLRNPKARALVLVHKTDDIYRKYHPLWENLKGHFGKRILIADELESICDRLNGMRKATEAQKNTALMIVALGYDELCEEFNQLPPKSQAIPSPNLPIGSSGQAVAMSNLGAMIAQLGGSPAANTLVPAANAADAGENVSAAYDARDDFNYISEKGGRTGRHVIVTFQSVRSMRKCRLLPLDAFEHKIALKMSSDNSFTYLGDVKLASELNDVCAVYVEGGTDARRFRPYKLPTLS